MGKRIVSLILTLVMLLTALPIGVFAEEEQQNLTPSVAVETVEAPAAEQPKTEEPETPAQPAAQEPEAPAEQPKAEEAPVQPAVKQELSEQPVAKQEEKEEPVVITYTVSFSDGFGWSASIKVEEGKTISDQMPSDDREAEERRTGSAQQGHQEGHHRRGP